MTRDRGIVDPWAGKGGPPRHRRPPVPPRQELADLAEPVGQPQSSGGEPPASPPRRHRPRIRWTHRWQVWVLLSALVVGGSGVWALTALLKLPTTADCAAVFWPLASASTRLSCAQAVAQRQTVEDLLKAISLVNDLPQDHPMRGAVNRAIEQWATDILRLSEDEFNAGKFSEAIASVRRIPSNTSAFQFVKERIDRWTRIWNNAEAIYRQAEEDLRQQDFSQAFRQAVRLLAVGNTYWETTKYRELLDNIREAREGGNILARARRLSEQGDLNSILKAIKMVDGIGPESYLYRAAQQAVITFSRKLLDLAQTRIDGGSNLEEALSIVRQIPQKAGLESEIQDFTSLAQAQMQAREGGLADLDTAIAQAAKIGPQRPLYGKAQQLITRWQLEIEAVGYLERARQLAAGGTIADLNAAIAEAQNVSRSNPRSSEALREINRWTTQIQTAEDRPLLDQAEAIALSGDVASLLEAIEQAKRIAPGRALSGEAQTKIRTWTTQIETTQDKPYLDRARELANSGNLPGAIAMAQQIRSGRSLYQEAQSSISIWQGTVNAQQTLQRAYQLARTETPDNLAAAIRSANQVPRSSNLRDEADSLINQWSQQILAVAQAQAQYNLLDRAIEIAEKVPPRTEAYASAQLQIAEWRKQLNRQ